MPDLGPVPIDAAALAILADALSGTRHAVDAVRGS
jgi:hypothetical protein